MGHPIELSHILFVSLQVRSTPYYVKIIGIFSKYPPPLRPPDVAWHAWPWPPAPGGGGAYCGSTTPRCPLRLPEHAQQPVPQAASRRPVRAERRKRDEPVGDGGGGGAVRVRGDRTMR